MCCPLLRQLPCLRLRTLTQQQEIHGHAGPEFEVVDSVNFFVLKLRHRNSPLNQNTRVSQLRVKPSMHSWNKTEASHGMDNQEGEWERVELCCTGQSCTTYSGHSAYSLKYFFRIEGSLHDAQKDRTKPSKHQKQFLPIFNKYCLPWLL